MRFRFLSKIFNEDNYTELTDQLNTIFGNNITLENNMSGQLVSVTIPKGEEVAISHNLGVVPTAWFAVRKQGLGFVRDGLQPFTAETIYLLNNDVGASAGFSQDDSVTYTILIMRG